MNESTAATAVSEKIFFSFDLLVTTFYIGRYVLYRREFGLVSSSELPHYLMWRIWAGNQLSFIIKAVLEEDKPSQGEI